MVNCLRFEDFVQFIENSIDLMFAPAMLPMLYIYYCLEFPREASIAGFATASLFGLASYFLLLISHYMKLRM